MVGYEGSGEGEVGFAYEEDRLGGVEGDCGFLMLLWWLLLLAAVSGTAGYLLPLSCRPIVHSGLVGLGPRGGLLLLLDCFGGMMQPATPFRHEQRITEPQCVWYFVGG